MNFPQARFNEVYLDKFDASTPVWTTIYKVDQTNPPPTNPTYNQIVQMVWS